MSLSINGTLISEDTEGVVFNQVPLDAVYFNNIKVWQKYAGPASPRFVTASATLTAGIDFPADTDISVCMAGGGGGGFADGGYAAQIQQFSINEPHGTQLIFSNGAGGDVFGGSGGSSSFAGITATGGSGATHTGGYPGNHASSVTCDGRTVYDGWNAFNNSSYNQGGGQRCLGNGGNGVGGNSAGNPGIYGAGGGGFNGREGRPGFGGAGVLILMW